MPWIVPQQSERARNRMRESTDRLQGACRDTIEAVIVQASALLRRRGSEDLGLVAALIRNAPHCAPCIMLLTSLDARRVYAALERLKSEAKARLVSGRCSRCQRTTTVHVSGE
jgi:hypothetical protein